MTNIPFTPLLALGTLVFTFVNFLKYLTNRNWNAALTQVAAWVSGILAVALAAQAQFASGIVVGGIALAKLNWASQLMLGLLATSLLSTVTTLTSLGASQPTAAAAKLFPRLPHVVAPPDVVNEPIHVGRPVAGPVQTG
jgi:hypothetical protein